MDTSKLKPFNLERALAGDPVVTTEGVKVIQMALFPDCRESERLIVLLEGENVCRTYNSKGQWGGGSGYFMLHDLFMAPKQREVWVNLYETDPSKSTSSGIAYHYSSQEIADDNHLTQTPRLGNCAHKITIEE